MAAFIPKRELLNAQFEGYKLSDNTLTLIRKKLPDPVRVAKLKEDEFSYQHVRAHTLHNHLQYDPLDPYSVYWCDYEGSVIKGTLSNDFLSTHKVFSHSHSTSKIEPGTNSSMLFLGNGMGLSCAGDNRIILFKKEACSSTETTSEQWSVLNTVTAGDFGEPVMIVTAGLGATGSYVDILCVQFSSSSREVPASMPEQGNISIVYKWLRINLRVNPSVTSNIKAEDVLGHHVMCEIPSSSHALYAAFQHESNTMSTQLLFMSETTPIAIATPSGQTEMEETSEKRGVCSGGVCNEKDSDDGDIFEKPDKHGLGYKDDEGEVYQWSQTEEDVVISFHLDEDVTKKDVLCVIEYNEVSVGLSDGRTLLRGELAHDIDLQGSTWTIDKHILEVTLGKKVEGIEWKYVLRQEKDKKLSSLPLSEGLKDLSKEELERAKDLLRSLSGEAVPSEKRTCPMMQGMLEECDSSEEDAVMFVLSEQGQIQHRASLGGRQLLFVAASQGRGHPNIFSLRHDVDATVWLPHAALTTSHTRWSHISTFSALGYVQASKRERKFTTCSPNLKFAVISDCTRHIFIYLQPDGKSKFAVEYVHSFLEPMRILGVAASDAGLVFVLTDEELNVLKIPNYS